MIVCAALALAAGCTGPVEGSSPLGLWVWNAGHEASVVDVAILRDGERWRATVDGQPADVTIDGRNVSLAAPNGQSFVGHIVGYGVGNGAGNASSIRGRWRQPSSSLAYSEMVTLTDLTAVDGGGWRARVDLQARPFRVFLDVFEDAQGELAAVIRNPERNEIMRAGRFRVEKDGKDRWTLVAGQGERQIRQSVRRNGDELQLDHSWFGTALTLLPASETDAAAYYPRYPAAQAARYAPPPRLDDGWTVATAEEAGFDRQALDALVAELAGADPRNRRPRLIHSVLVAHKGRLLLEEYFYGHDRTMRHDTRSLGKVFAPVLIGALQQQGVDIDADVRPIADVLAAAGEALDDPRKKDITLAHLMSFTSGLDCDVNRDSPGSEDRMWGQQDEDDFWLYTARLPLLHEPGERYAYCSGSINLVGASLRAAGGKPIVELFDDLIAQPLEFGTYHWNLAPNGAAYLGGGTYMRPRDILKIGAMFAANGVWRGEQIVTPAWVEESTTAVIEITAGSTGMTADAFENSYFGGGSAYEWRTDRVRAGDRTYSSYEATGNGGQVLIVVPDLELTVLFMGGNYRQGGVWGRWRNEIVGGHIIPAMRSLP